MAFSAKHCCEKRVKSILTHYASVMKVSVQRRTGQQGKERGKTATTKYPSDTGALCQAWSEFNQKKNKWKIMKMLQSNPLIFLFLYILSKATQGLLSLAASRRRLATGPLSDSCCAFVIKYAQALYRLMTSPINGNYRSHRLVGVPIRPKHPVSDVSNHTSTLMVAALLNPIVPTLVGVDYSRVVTNKICQYWQSSTRQHLMS